MTTLNKIVCDQSNGKGYCRIRHGACDISRLRHDYPHAHDENGLCDWGTCRGKSAHCKPVKAGAPKKFRPTSCFGCKHILLGYQDFPCRVCGEPEPPYSRYEPNGKTPRKLVRKRQTLPALSTVTPSTDACPSCGQTLPKLSEYEVIRITRDHYCAPQTRRRDLRMRVDPQSGLYLQIRVRNI